MPSIHGFERILSQLQISIINFSKNFNQKEPFQYAVALHTTANCWRLLFDLAQLLKRGATSENFFSSKLAIQYWSFRPRSNFLAKINFSWPIKQAQELCDRKNNQSGIGGPLYRTNSSSQSKVTSVP